MIDKYVKQKTKRRHTLSVFVHKILSYNEADIEAMFLLYILM